jgi:hypothetical protein
MDKSIVSMEQKQCAICDRAFETNSLLLQTRAINKPKLDRYTITGMGICPNCTKEGFIPLIVIDATRSDKTSVYKTGEVIYIKKEAASRIFDVRIGEFSFIDQEAAENIKSHLSE